jgi:ATP-dependent helicase/nuclease subunit A
VRQSGGEVIKKVPDPEARQLIAAQAEAAHALDRHVSVTAGPGSGKTTVLVERYLHILKTRDVSIDQVVAITFTNRAASEMRERLRRELDSLIARSDPEQRARWAQHKRRLDGAIITTIHGFCAGLLREFPIEAGLDPEFSLLDEHQTLMLEESIVKQMVTEWIGSDDEIVSRLAAGIGRIKLASTSASIYRSMRSQGLTARQVAARTLESHSTRADYDEALDKLNAAMSELIGMTGLRGVAESKRKTIEREWPKLQSTLNLSATASNVADFCREIEDFRKWRPSARDQLKPIIQELDGLIWETEMAGLVPRVWLDFQARDYSEKLAEMAAGLEGRLKEEKSRMSALDFDDLQINVLDMLDRHPELLKKATARYRYFLVDEFQDTNSLQRDLMERLALGQSGGANLFIVGDRKQSIYGFRGADVQVFQEMAAALESEGGSSKPLHLNFRSQAPLIDCFNHIFRHVFAAPQDIPETERQELGYVEHEDSVAQRAVRDGIQLAELLIDTGPDLQADSEEAGQSRERDARQVALRCRALVDGPGTAGENDPPEKRFRYSDIAILFRAMTQASLYETVLRRNGVPYQTIQGRGFYDRREVTDLIQLLRFLDNRTDDLALAAVLRSPLCGLSDNSLIAIGAEDLLRGKRRTGRHGRALWSSVLRHQGNDLIPDVERSSVERAAGLLTELVRIRHEYRVSDLLRHAADITEYRTIIAASFEGAQRLANVEKLLTLAERFERSGAHNIRDFVRFVGDFERSSGREGEGRIDESEDAVRLMTIHQAKGLQFPVVIIPELHRKPQEKTDWFILDRGRGLTVKVPDGRASLATGITMERLRDRARWRDKFESARLLYVGATRAEDLLILTGSAADPQTLADESETWLAWIWQALSPQSDPPRKGSIEITKDARIKLEFNFGETQIDRPTTTKRTRSAVDGAATEIDLSRTPRELFPLLAKLKQPGSESHSSLSVTQLTNYARCPRQYYFDRILHAPERAELAVWDAVDAAEVPEPPANMTASQKGAAIHLFCERFQDGMDPDGCLRSSLDYVLRMRTIDRGEAVARIKKDAAMAELRPLASNYLSSDVRRRIEAAREPWRSTTPIAGHPAWAAVFSEQSFTLRRNQWTLRGTIDKLLVSRNEDGDLQAEIIDFKTNRIRSRLPSGDTPTYSEGRRDRKGQRREIDPSVANAIESAAAGVRIQMQVYSLAAWDLLPGLRQVKATLHFVHPNIEYGLSAELLEAGECGAAVDDLTSKARAASDDGVYPPRTGRHCKTCGFLTICQPGRQAVKTSQNQ